MHPCSLRATSRPRHARRAHGALSEETRARLRVAPGARLPFAARGCHAFARAMGRGRLRPPIHALSDPPSPSSEPAPADVKRGWSGRARERYGEEAWARAVREHWEERFFRHARLLTDGLDRRDVPRWPAREERNA